MVRTEYPQASSAYFIVDFYSPLLGFQRGGDAASEIRYSQNMRRFSTSLAAFACLCLLVLQLGGIHLHVDIDSDDAGLHGAHTHQAPSHDADHSGEVDVQLLEQFIGQWSKIVAQVCYVLLLIVAVWIFRPTWSPPLGSAKIARRLHWRPQLRAPPLHL